MKRNFVKIAFVVAIAMIAGDNVYNAQKQIELSDIAMDNVEADKSLHNSNPNPKQ